MYNIYAQGYTNCKNILVDFVDKLCFSNEMPEHRWRLHYPRNENVENTLEIYEMENPTELIENLKEKILNERRATISTIYTPPSKWTETEIHYIDPADIHQGQALIKPKYPIYKDTIVELAKHPEKMYFYQNQEVKSKDELSLLEFTVDYQKSEIYINQESVSIDENTKILSDISILLHWNPGCGNQQGTCLMLVDENWDIKLFMRPYDASANTGTYNISSNLDDLIITRTGANNKDVIIDVKPESESSHRYYIFWYNTKGNSHTTCKHIDISYIDNTTGEKQLLNAVNINQSFIQNLGDYSADTKLPLYIYDYENNQIQYDTNNHKILPLFTLDFISNTIKISKYIYNPGNQPIKLPLSEEIDVESPDPDLTYNKPNYGPPIPFSIRYQTNNGIGYIWYVSLFYPQYSNIPKFIPYIPHIPLPNFYNKIIEKANVIIRMGVKNHIYDDVARICILNNNNLVVAYGFVQGNVSYYITPSYSNKLKTTNNDFFELHIDSDNAGDTYSIIFVGLSNNIQNTNSTLQLYITYQHPIINTRINACSMNILDAYLVESLIDLDSSIKVGHPLPIFYDINNNQLKPNVIIDDEKTILLYPTGDTKQVDRMIEWPISGLKEVLEEALKKNKEIDKQNKEIREQNKIIMTEKLSYTNNSYFIWQYGQEIDANGFIKQHKNHDSPVFAHFFHNFRIYDDNYDFSWNPITYYITWDDRGCSFMFCEDPVLGVAVHGFSYFGALTNFTQKLKDDYSGNFGSFGNNLLEAEIQDIIVPEFDGMLTIYDDNKYNIKVYLRSYFGKFLLQILENPILSFLDCEIIFDLEKIIDIAGDINNLPIEYYMVGSETLEYDNIEIEQIDNTYNYYITYIDTSFTEPALTPIEIEDYIEVYANDNTIIPISAITNVDETSAYTPLLKFENSNDNINVLIDSNNNLIINPNGFVEDTIITLTSIAKIEKYGFKIEFPYETKEITIVSWDFSDISMEEVI